MFVSHVLEFYSSLPLESVAQGLLKLFIIYNYVYYVELSIIVMIVFFINQTSSKPPALPPSEVL